uniref:Uncharacterized protein n=1 Tax=Anguilla anguilla TaxID=7936 RepID=A0A0E9VYE0_ANGAN
MLFFTVTLFQTQSHVPTLHLQYSAVCMYLDSDTLLVVLPLLK